MEMPEPCSVRRLAIVPTIVTSRPSSTHTAPRPMTTSQCQRDHGRRSIRDGMSVSMVRSSTGPAIRASSRSTVVMYPTLDSLQTGPGTGTGVSDHTTPPDPTSDPDMAPGDEAPPRTEAAGADVCPECNGSGKLDGSECPACEGTGNVMRGSGGG